MSREVQLSLGVNGAFLTRRWEQPDSWMRLTQELGFKHHEFCGDVLDPFFSGDKAYQKQTARWVYAAAEKYGITITDIYTGVATHRFHGLSHSSETCRNRMKQWLYETMDLAVEMGTTAIGGHWDAVSIERMADDEWYQQDIDRLCDTFVEVANVGGEKGMKAIYLEQMYIPSEAPWTIEQAEYMMVRIHKQKPAIPVYLTIDVGHMAGMHYGLEGDSLSYVEWLKRLAPFAEIVHVQQTSPEGSHHWPFTEECNAKGHVEIPAVLDAIAEGHANVENSPVAEYLKPVDHTYMIAEIIPGSTKNEDTVLDELKISADYLKQWMPDGELTLTV